MIATETARTILMVLFGLSVVWVISCVIRNDTATIIRALVVAVVLGLAFFYVHQTKLQTLSFKNIKEDLFPSAPLSLSFDKRETTIDGVQQIIYSFAEPGPELHLSLEEGGKYLSIPDVEPLNRVLDYVGLPPVKHGVPELSSLTKSDLDANKYRWDDYEMGTLIIERGICRNVRTAQTYPCIQAITVIIR
jgi:hypothetical protein